MCIVIDVNVCYSIRFVEDNSFKTLSLTDWQSVYEQVCNKYICCVFFITGLLTKTLKRMGKEGDNEV